MRLRRASSLILGASLLAVFAGCAGSQSEDRANTRIDKNRDWMIVATGDWRQRRLGSYYYKRDLTLGKSYIAAVKAFGPPSSRGSENQSNVCIARWQRLALEIHFSGWPTNPCATKRLRKSGWWEARVYSRRWQTDRGLRVGDSEQRLRRLYPKARFSDKPPIQPSWVLARVREDEFVWDLLVAEVWDGRVTAIVTPADYIY